MGDPVARALRRLIWVLLSGSVSTAGLAANLEPVHPGDGAFSLPSGDGVVVWSQLDDPSGYALVDQAFESWYASYNSEAADDFMVQVSGPECEFAVDGVSTAGVQFTPGTDPLFVNVAFYADAGGLPGAPLPDCEFPANTNFVSDGNGDLAIEVDCPGFQTFSYNTFWVSQQVRQDYLIQGIHYWATRASTELAPAAWRNPGNEFGTGCFDWQPANEVCRAMGQDLLMELSGYFVPNSCPPFGGDVPAVGPVGVVILAVACGAGATWTLYRRR